MTKTWLEAALNGPWQRKNQPNIPITVDEVIAEGIAAAKAGVAIVHIHAYDPDTGVQNDSPEIYARDHRGHPCQGRRDRLPDHQQRDAAGLGSRRRRCLAL